MFVSRLVLLLGASLLVISAAPFPGAVELDREVEGAGQPNIVLILSDDQRLGLLDVMPVVRRRIQQVGITYTEAMVPTALCCPSRASLLTGKFSHGTRVWGNNLEGDPPLTGGVSAFDYWGNQDQTIAKALDDVGYRTVLIGKYLNGYDPAGGAPLGWDAFYAFAGLGSYYDYNLGGVDYAHEEADYSTDVIRQVTIDELQSASSDEPWFFYIAPFGPHSPAIPAPRHQDAPVGQYVDSADFGAFDEPDVADKPAYIRQLSGIDQEHARAFARDQHRAMMSIDELTGAVLDTLRTRGELSNTLVIYMSDNGHLWGEHRWIGKNVPYARTTEIPLLMRWYGHIAEGASSDRIALNVDVTATIADAAGVEMPWSEGHSLLGTETRDGFVLEAIAQSPPYKSRPAYCGWRTIDRLYVRYSTGEEELYLYKRDPDERQNLADSREYADMVKAMRAKARAACVPVPPGFTWQVGLTPAAAGFAPQCVRHGGSGGFPAV